MERVVITGMGAVTPLGHDVESTWRAMLEGRSGAAPIRRFDASGLPVRFAAEVKGWDPIPYLGAREARRTDRFQQFALVAADEALRQAELTIDASNRDDVGVIVGSGIGGLATLAEQIEVLRTRGPERVSPFISPMMLIDLAAGMIAIRTGARGPNFAVVSACATSTHSLGEAYETIRRGAAQAMIAGGSEAGILPIAIAGFAAARALSTRNDAPERASRPFDRDRDGFVMGEGAGILILESLSFARRRGAPILAEIVGYGASDDASHVTAPDEDGAGLQQAIEKALCQAGLRPGDVDYVNAHGTSTPLNDRLETRALKRCFGEAAYRLPISSTKSMTGHLLGAGGAVESIACLLAMRDSMVPPTINLINPDPDCDLDYVANRARPHRVRVALNISAGFGGHNAALCFRRWDEDA